MTIGKLSFGIRWNKNDWKKYLLPRETQGKCHPYFAFGIWWLIFYLYYPKKCPICKNWMPNSGGTAEYDLNGDFLKVICSPCFKDKFFKQLNITERK
jgi:hypothetical protein